MAGVFIDSNNLSLTTAPHFLNAKRVQEEVLGLANDLKNVDEYEADKLKGREGEVYVKGTYSDPSFGAGEREGYVKFSPCHRSAHSDGFTLEKHDNLMVFEHRETFPARQQVKSYEYTRGRGDSPTPPSPEYTRIDPAECYIINDSTGVKESVIAFQDGTLYYQTGPNESAPKEPDPGKH